MDKTPFKVGDVVRDPWGRAGTIFRISPGLATGRLMHSVSYDDGPKGKALGFYYAEELKFKD